MGFEVHGNGNRVAGRDYYENRSRPCPKCEQRFITQGMTICNNCRAHQEMLEARTKLTGLGVATLVVFGWLMGRRSESNVVTEPSDLLVLLLSSAGIVFSVVLVYMLAAEWLRNR
ncbi:MAG: hypothetical protein ACRBBM_00560 [Pseudomonadaceae bacterium]